MTILQALKAATPMSQAVIEEPTILQKWNSVVIPELVLTASPTGSPITTPHGSPNASPGDSPKMPILDFSKLDELHMKPVHESPTQLDPTIPIIHVESPSPEGSLLGSPTLCEDNEQSREEEIQRVLKITLDGTPLESTKKVTPVSRKPRTQKRPSPPKRFGSFADSTHERFADQRCLPPGAPGRRPNRFDKSKIIKDEDGNKRDSRYSSAGCKRGEQFATLGYRPHYGAGKAWFMWGDSDEEEVAEDLIDEALQAKGKRKRCPDRPRELEHTISTPLIVAASALQNGGKVPVFAMGVPYSVMLCHQDDLEFQQSRLHNQEKRERRLKREQSKLKRELSTRRRRERHRLRKQQERALHQAEALARSQNSFRQSIFGTLTRPSSASVKSAPSNLEKDEEERMMMEHLKDAAINYYETSPATLSPDHEPHVRASSSNVPQRKQDFAASKNLRRMNSGRSLRARISATSPGSSKMDGIEDERHGLYHSSSRSRLVLGKLKDHVSGWLDSLDRSSSSSAYSSISGSSSSTPSSSSWSTRVEEERERLHQKVLQSEGRLATLIERFPETLKPIAASGNRAKEFHRKRRRKYRSYGLLAIFFCAAITFLVFL